MEASDMNERTVAELERMIRLELSKAVMTIMSQPQWIWELLKNHHKDGIELHIICKLEKMCTELNQPEYKRAIGALYKMRKEKGENE